MTTNTESTPLDEIVHFGVKGMHWGVRHDKPSSSSSTYNVAGHQFDKKKVKRAAVIFGAAVGVAAITVGSIYLGKSLDSGVGNKLMSDIHPTKAADKFVSAMAKEPLGIVHASRAKTRGFTFPGHGGLENPMREWETAGFDSNGDAPNFFKRYGSRGEKVAATFLDPEGRKDQSGRVIPHSVMIPEEMAKNIKSHQDAVDVSWPLIKDVFGSFYESGVVP